MRQTIKQATNGAIKLSNLDADTGSRKRQYSAATGNQLMRRPFMPDATLRDATTVAGSPEAEIMNSHVWILAFRQSACRETRGFSAMNFGPKLAELRVSPSIPFQGAGGRQLVNACAAPGTQRDEILFSAHQKVLADCGLIIRCQTRKALFSAKTRKQALKPIPTGHKLEHLFARIKPVSVTA